MFLEELKELKFSRSEDDQIKNLMKISLSNNGNISETNSIKNSDKNNKKIVNVNIKSDKIDEDSNSLTTNIKLLDQYKTSNNEFDNFNENSNIRSDQMNDKYIIFEKNIDEFNKRLARLETSLEGNLNLHKVYTKEYLSKNQTDQLTSKTEKLNATSSSESRKANTNPSHSQQHLLNDRKVFPMRNEGYSKNIDSTFMKSNQMNSPSFLKLNQATICVTDIRSDIPGTTSVYNFKDKHTSLNESVLNKLEKMLEKSDSNRNNFTNTNSLTNETAIRLRYTFNK